MSEETQEIRFCFQPFTGLEYDDTPILCFTFEGQQDLILASAFPEIEAMRARFDGQRRHGEETITVFNVMRNGKMITLGIIYIQQAWRRAKSASDADVDSINFYEKVRERTAAAVRRLREMKHKNAVFVLPSKFKTDNISNDMRQQRRLQKFVRTVTEAVEYGNGIPGSAIELERTHLKEVTFIHCGESSREVDNFFRRSLQEGQVVGSALSYARHLIRLPPNRKNPLEFIRAATGAEANPKSASSKKWHAIYGHNFSSRTKISYLYGKEGIERFGLRLVVAVGKGSRHEPAFLKVHYRPGTERQKPVRRAVLIGKGVTFDTGGLDLKLTGYYDRMHYDVGGAATALAVVKAADALSLPVEIIALIPLVENSIGPNATLPHEVIAAYDGQTVEILNTDCEGRLILADSVCYAERHLKADITIVTGTLGDISDHGPDFLKVGAGNTQMRRRLHIAERESAEKMILLPSLEHLNEVDNEHMGEVSDLVNDPGYYHTAPFVFLSNFFRHDQTPWAFVDISIVMERDADNYGNGPGFGTKFILSLLRQYT